MDIEKKLAEYVTATAFEDIPGEPVFLAKRVILNIFGALVAGSTAEGCKGLRDQVREWGGREEATILIYGGKVPAHNAAFINSVMARALDICDSIRPGMHVGSSSVPTALAAAELAKGCSGKEFLAALVLGTEIAARINSISDYDGFDPTGVCSIFAAAAVAGRILGLDREQMLNTLALAFNRSGGSFQSNVDGALAVRIIQGFVSKGGMICAELARRGMTGPINFLEGVYGYFHLYAKDVPDKHSVIRELGHQYKMTDTFFKNHPSCGGTLASTDAMLHIMSEKNLSPEDVSEIHVKVSPYHYKLVGHQFEIGENPRVNAQFNIQYCVSNALHRGVPKLEHFEGSSVKAPRILAFLKKVHVTPFTEKEHADPLFERAATADMKVTTLKGDVYHKRVNIPRGFPGNPMTDRENMARLQDYFSYGKKPLPEKNIREVIDMVDQMEVLDDVSRLVPLLLVD
jgi:2-methylcitrate dehydratase PrpD